HALKRRDQPSGCPLIGALVDEPPKDERQVNDIEHPPQRGRIVFERKRISRTRDSVPKDRLNPLTRESSGRRKQPLMVVADEYREKRRQRIPLWPKNSEASFQSEGEPLAPRAGLHLRGPGCVLRRKGRVESENE